MKKIILMTIILSGVIFLSGCGEKNTQNNIKDDSFPTVEKESVKNEAKDSESRSVSIAEIDNICSKYDDFMASFCYVEAAVDKKSVDICKKIKGNPEELEFTEERCKDAVNKEIALENKDFQYCLKISDNTDCIRELASITGDSSFCSQVKHEQYVSICQEEADITRKINEAVDKGDKTICESIEFYQDRGDCFEKLGISLNDPSVCELAQMEEDTSKFNRSTCYYELAKLNANTSYCEEIMDFGNWGEGCLDDVDAIQKYLDQCLQKDGADKSSCLSMIVSVFNETDDLSVGDSDYSPIALKSSYDKIKNKCSEWGGSNMVIKNECERIADEIYQKKVEINF